MDPWYVVIFVRQNFFEIALRSWIFKRRFFVYENFLLRGSNYYLKWVKINIWVNISRKGTAQKIKFSTKDFFSKCDQIRR